jgi:putative Holliday junction resolvase
MNSRLDAKPAAKARVLGIDYGSKRSGVAVSDENRQFALPLIVVQNTRDLVEEIAKIALRHQAREIVLGESRNYKGEPNLILTDSIDFKKKLEARGLVVHFEEEFMTSAQAERLQGKNDKTDASAAALILQSYLDRINAGK